MIKEFEGLYLKAYKCPAGVWTIGYGTTSADSAITGTKIYAGMTITKETASHWLRLSVNRKYAPNVAAFDGYYHWTQNEFDALTSFAYNLGSINGLVSNGQLPKSQIPAKMRQYVYGGGVRLPGLVRRREAEIKLFGGEIEPKTLINWLPAVSGFSRGDAVNGYAGLIGRPVTALRVSGSTRYRVHIAGGNWLPEVTGNNPNDFNNGYAGMPGRPIDGVAISGARYAVHIQGGGWLPEVTGYNINDFNNGYAGILGRRIDAVMIQGRTYATGY